MELDGFRTIFDSEVAYLPGEKIAPVGLDPDAMKTFCSPSDAEQIFQIVKQVLPKATLVGTTGEFTATYGQNHILAAGPNQIYADAGSVGGQYMYRTSDGYRPIRIQSVSDGLDQFVAELVASYDGSKNGLTLVSTPQGKKLVWA